MSSVMGIVSGDPYVAAVEDNTIFLTPTLSMAFNSEFAPPTLLPKYFSGAAMDSPTSESAAM